MKLYYSLFVIFAFTLSSCAPTVKVSRLAERPALPADTKVEVFYLSRQIPAKAEIIGVVNIGDNGFTANCSYDAVVVAASNQARALGANALNIAEHKFPDATNSCHRITAFAYYISSEVLTAMEADDILPIDLVEADGENLTGQAFPEQTEYSPTSGRVSDKAPKYAPDYSLSKYQSLGERIRVGIDVGFAYRLGKFNKISDEFLVNRKGFNYGLELIFFNRGTYGWGPKYIGRTYAKHFNNYLGDGNSRMNMNYFGLAFMRRMFDINHKNAFVFSISGGCIYYTEKLVVDNIKSTIYDRAGVGATCEFGYDFRISRSTFFGLKLGASYGGVVAGGIMNSISSIDLTGGIRF